MVSRRNYIAITMMFLILFFMFQFSGIMKEQLNEYESNAYAKTTGTALTSVDCFVPQEDGAELFCVGGDARVTGVVEAFCTYSKRNLHCVSGVGELEGLPVQGKIVVIDGICVTEESEVETLRTLAEERTNLIFARLPAYDFIADSTGLRELLGIYQAYRPEVVLSGMHLFPGFLLGGEALYEVQTEGDSERQDMAIGLPWYVTGKGTKTYMVGTLTDEAYQEAVDDGIAQKFFLVGTDEESTKNSVLPAVLWRKSFSESRVFCVNGDFLTEQAGIGILSAFLAECSAYELYPVVNAQNLVIAGYPVFSEENSEEMGRYYSQPPSAVYQDIVWPSLISTANRTRSKMTCMMTPRFRYEEEGELSGEQVSFYLKLFHEEDIEAGLSAASGKALSIADKLREDAGFWEEYAPDYTFLSMVLENNSQLTEEEAAALPASIRTAAVQDQSGEYPVVGYIGEKLTAQYAMGNGVTHTFMGDFRLRCIETALGYSTIVLDLERVTYPESEEDSWHTLSKKIAANLVTYWKPYDAFEETTLAQSDDRIRRFLTLDYTSERNSDTIQLTIEHFDGEAYFLLRLSGEKVKHIEGGSVTGVETDVYLIRATEPEISIQVEKEEKW